METEKSQEYPINASGKKSHAKSGVSHKKLPRLDSKVGKYFVARRQGKNGKESAIIAGINPAHSSRMETTEGYKRLSYKEEMLMQITLEQLAREQLKVILQDGDLGAKNTAIKNTIDKLEPEKLVASEPERVLVVLR